MDKMKGSVCLAERDNSRSIFIDRCDAKDSISRYACYWQITGVILP